MLSLCLHTRSVTPEKVSFSNATCLSRDTGKRESCINSSQERQETEILFCAGHTDILCSKLRKTMNHSRNKRSLEQTPASQMPLILIHISNSLSALTRSRRKRLDQVDKTGREWLRLMLYRPASCMGGGPSFLFSGSLCILLAAAVNCSPILYA
jgi:hypothetical protein